MLIRSWMLLLLMSLFFYEPTHAQSSITGKKASTRMAKIGFIYEQYSGESYKSLTEGGPGYGGELSIDDGNNFIRYFLKARVTSSTGHITVNDGSSSVYSSYLITQMAPELGVSLYPVARKDKGLNMYVWGTGILSYNLLELSPVSTTTNGNTTSVSSYTYLSKKDQGMGYGFGAGVGFELTIAFSKNSKKALYGEIGFRQQTAELANTKSFQLNSLAFVLGVGF